MFLTLPFSRRISNHSEAISSRGTHAPLTRILFPKGSEGTKPLGPSVGDARGYVNGKRLRVHSSVLFYRQPARQRRNQSGVRRIGSEPVDLQLGRSENSPAREVRLFQCPEVSLGSIKFGSTRPTSMNLKTEAGPAVWVTSVFNDLDDDQNPGPSCPARRQRSTAIADGVLQPGRSQVMRSCVTEYPMEVDPRLIDESNVERWLPRLWESARRERNWHRRFSARLGNSRDN